MPEQTAPDDGALRFVMDVWPVLALGVIGAVLIRACVPAHPSTAPATSAPLDAAAPAGSSSARAIAALSALTPDSSIEQVMDALNLVAVDFATGSSTPPETAGAVLTKVATVILARPSSERFEISAHADGTRSPLADLELSRRRGQALVDFLVNEGVPTQRLQALGVGDPDPGTSEPGQESILRNRQVQFTLLP